MLIRHTNIDCLNPYPAALALQDLLRHLLDCLHAAQVSPTAAGAQRSTAPVVGVTV